MSTIAQLDAEIQEAQAELDRMIAARAQMQTDLDTANSLRPTGIPLTWKPYYDGTAVTLRVYAWFDPTKFGEQLFVRTIGTR